MLNKESRAYSILTSLVICGLAASIVTAPKVVHFGLNFPFSNIIFSMLTYPIIDCICELWGKEVAKQTIWLALGCQCFIALLIQLSVIAPAATFWQMQQAYQTVLSVSGLVVISSLLAFGLSQLLDIFVYQYMKEKCHGRFLWLRSNISTYIGQMLDSCIFVSLVFYTSDQKMNILVGSISVKILVSFLMTPFVYGVVILVNRSLNSQTLAFQGSN